VAHKKEIPTAIPTFSMLSFFNGANSYVAGSRYVTGNIYGGQQTGNNYVSGYSTVTVTKFFPPFERPLHNGPII